MGFGEFLGFCGFGGFHGFDTKNWSIAVWAAYVKNFF
jgi:hypothetical protein